MDKKIGVGLVGLGFASNPHEVGYLEMPDVCQIVALCDIKEEVARDRAQISNAKPYLKYLDLLDDPAVDVVDVTTQHESHYEIAKAALERGQTCVCGEANLCAFRVLGMELVELAKKKGVTLGVAENTPFVPAYLAAEKILKAGTLGNIWFVRTMIAGESLYDLVNPEHWLGTLPYGGFILDSSVHSFFLYKWLFGGAKDALGFASWFSNTKPGGGEWVDHWEASQRSGVRAVHHGRWEPSHGWNVWRSMAARALSPSIKWRPNPVMKIYMGSADMDGTVVEGVEYDPLGWKYNSLIAEVKDFIRALVDKRAPGWIPWTRYSALRSVSKPLKNRSK